MNLQGFRWKQSPEQVTSAVVRRTQQDQQVPGTSTWQQSQGCLPGTRQHCWAQPRGGEGGQSLLPLLLRAPAPCPCPAGCSSGQSPAFLRDDPCRNPGLSRALAGPAGAGDCRDRSEPRGTPWLCPAACSPLPLTSCACQGSCPTPQRAVGKPQPCACKPGHWQLPGDQPRPPMPHSSKGHSAACRAAAAPQASAPRAAATLRERPPQAPGQGRVDVALAA